MRDSRNSSIASVICMRPLWPMLICIRRWNDIFISIHFHSIRQCNSPGRPLNGRPGSRSTAKYGSEHPPTKHSIYHFRRCKANTSLSRSLSDDILLDALVRFQQMHHECQITLKQHSACNLICIFLFISTSLHESVCFHFDST